MEKTIAELLAEIARLKKEYASMHRLNLMVASDYIETIENQEQEITQLKNHIAELTHHRWLILR